jgi:alkylation response protein AidB-like acyl-CoA dehydrogenase
MLEEHLTDEHRLVRRTVRRWAEEDLAPEAREREERAAIEEAVYERAADLDLMGLLVPAEHGGLGLDTIGTALAVAEMGRGDPAVSLSVGAHNILACYAVDDAGSQDQRARWLPKLASGEALGAWALTEPGGGTDVAGMTTTARRDPDAGTWVLDGEKCFVTNGSRADLVVVTAALEGPEGGFRGHGAFVVEADRPGFEAASSHDVVCMAASDTASMRFEGVEVPEENLLGEPGEGLRYAMRVLDMERVTMGAVFTESARRDVDRALEYAKQREAFGDPIAQRQSVYGTLARLSTRIEAAETLWVRAALAMDGGGSASGPGARAKLMASELAQDAAATAVQVHGGAGLERENEVERSVRDNLLATVGGGTTHVQEMVVARDLGIDVDPYGS